MNRPSELIAGRPLYPLASPPSRATLTGVVVRASRSRTNTSLNPFASSGTKFDAYDVNATYRPSALIAALKLASLPPGTAGRHTDPLRPPGTRVPYEHVESAVAVVRHEIRSTRCERDVPAVRADR